MIDIFTANWLFVALGALTGALVVALPYELARRAAGRKRSDAQARRVATMLRNKAQARAEEAAKKTGQPF